MKSLLIVVTLFLSLEVSAQAQNRANFAWWNSPVVTDLNISETQRQQIRQIVASYRSKLIDARADTQKAHGELQDVLNADHIDMDQADAVIKKLAAAQAESTRVFTEMSVHLRAVLTLDQWRELVKRWGALEKGKRPTDTQVQP
jgi:Spy/CpxP family protein refolding chaperone